MDHPASKLYIRVASVTGFIWPLISAAYILYQIQIGKLEPWQLVIIGSALEISCFVLEIPTGIIADLYSRRLSVQIGMAFLAAGYLMELAWPMFSAFLVAQVVKGFGYTCISGAFGAWLADESQADLEPIYLKAARQQQVYGIAGTLVCMALGVINLRLVMGLVALLHAGLAVYLLIAMKESHFVPARSATKSVWQDMGATFTHGIRAVQGQSVLTILILVNLFFGLSSEGYDRLSPSFLTQVVKLPGPAPVVWLGAIDLLAMGISAVALHSIEKKGSGKKALSLISIGQCLSLLVFAVTRNFLLAVMFKLFFDVLRSLIEPICNSWMNQAAPGAERATVLSFHSQVNSLGQIFGGLMIAAVAAKSLPVAILVSAVILAPVPFLLLGLSRKRPVQQAA